MQRKSDSARRIDSSTATDTNKRMKSALIKAKNTVRKKFRELHDQRVSFEHGTNEEFKPITEHLNKLIGDDDNDKKKQIDEDEDVYGFYDNLSDVPDEKPFVTPRPRFNIGNKAKEILLRQIKQKNTPLMDMDYIYGFYAVNKDLFIGQDSVRVKERGPEKTFEVRGKEFPLTRGLTSLLMHSNPTNYNEKDLKSYKEILEHTSAHKHHFDPREQVNRQLGYKKYEKVIKGLYSETKRDKKNRRSAKKGSGLTHIYWTGDPNKLVDRLRFLIVSKSNGDSSHENEINSTIDELRKAKIIK